MPTNQRLPGALILVTLLLAGCSTYAAQRYSIAPNNIAVLRAFRGQAVNVGPFTAAKPGRSEITCRAVGPTRTPDGEPFEEYIRKAFIADLSIAEVYSTAAPVTLTGRVDALDFSSGLTDAAWDIAVTIQSSNGKSLSVANHYSFSGNFEGPRPDNPAVAPATGGSGDRVSEPSLVTVLESGDPGIPRSRKLQSLAKALRVPVAELLG